MALFGLKKKTNNKDQSEAKPTAVSSVSLPVIAGDIILRPRITEKATDKQAENVYVFEVASGANERMIARAFRQLYKVTPTKINVAKKPAKRIFIRGKWGMKSGISKAYIYLKEGDKIDIV